MNARTSKLLRKHSFQYAISYRQAKKHWQRVARPMRGKLRKELLCRVEEDA